MLKLLLFFIPTIYNSPCRSKHLRLCLKQRITSLLQTYFPIGLKSNNTIITRPCEVLLPQASVPLKITAVILALTRNLKFRLKSTWKTSNVTLINSPQGPTRREHSNSGLPDTGKAMVEWKLDTILHIFKCLPPPPVKRNLSRDPSIRLPWLQQSQFT